MSDFCVQHLLRQHRSVEESLSSIEARLQDPLPRCITTRRVRSVSIVCDLGRQLGPHLRKEADILLPALEAFLPRDSGPVAVLRSEYSALRTHLTSLRDTAILLWECGELPRGIEGPALEIIRIVRNQIYKEDRILFPMVRRLIPSEQDAMLLQRMESIGDFAE